MQFYVNGESKTLNDNACLVDLIESMGLVGKRIAIEVNQEIIPRSQHADYRIQENDQVEVVHAIGGG
ncbi:sulfur carrier protein ThiS [Neptunomonas phycophila]|jgi:sulfur carrier protein|uniref:Sulfur carrier protein ThiS n=1 Tax=Neptunomonas phycophila TaxID=1572645 RepID=A0ABT9ET69_9GAMM|nr:sulfur carrier protein ThiS [Neptunomonas phycophila]MDO6468261.1 sulfur carrier protein ThiS [Neptunomonas phycophila]MDO6784708.1 sulfur carrier protein ThiS [Neptunomonas phycophila]MDP2522270.1 sulfur carrier protein ThiS [Neptunomonas phycophila]